MKAITYEYARKNFDGVFDMIDVENDGIIIVKEDKNFVLMDKGKTTGQANCWPSKDKKFVASLIKAKAEMEKGESFTFEEVFG